MSKLPADTPRLWGFDGEIAGNEHRMMARLPVLRFGDRRLAFVRSLPWSRQVDGTLSWLADECEAREAGTPLRLGKAPLVADNVGVTLLGRDFYADAMALPGVGSWEALRAAQPAQDGLRCVLLAPDVYMALATRLSTAACAVFDRALANARGEWLAEEASRALRVIEGSPATRVDDGLVRALVAARLTHDSDAYRRRLELGALRVRETPETVTRWVDEYRQRMPAERTWTAAEARARKLIAETDNSQMPQGSPRLGFFAGPRLSQAAALHKV